MDLYHREETDIPKAFHIMTNLSSQNYSFASYALLMNIVKNPKFHKVSSENYKIELIDMCGDGVLDACERLGLILYEENDLTAAKEIFSVLADYSFQISKTMMCAIATRSRNQCLHDKYCVGPFNIEVLHHLTKEFLKIQNFKALKTLIQTKLPITDAKSLIRDKIYVDFGKHSLIQHEEYGNYLRKVQDMFNSFSIPRPVGDFKLMVENYFNSLNKVSESSRLQFQKIKLYRPKPWKLPEGTIESKIEYCNLMNQLAIIELTNFLVYFTPLKACSETLNHVISQFNIGIQLIKGKQMIQDIPIGWKWVELAARNGYLPAAEWLVRNVPELDERLPKYLIIRNKLKAKSKNKQ